VTFFAIIEVSDQTKPPDNAICTGDLDTLFALLPDTVARREATQRLDQREAAAAQVEQQQIRNGEALQSILSDTLPRLTGYLDEIVSAREQQVREDKERAAKERAEAEEQARAKQIADALKALPDQPEAHGELIVHKASEPRREAELAGDALGDLPNALLRKAPPLEAGTETEPQLSGGFQPTAREPAVVDLM
jgi:hypothetical protein